MINGELIVDNFAGGGGASTGMEMATGYSVDIAINHDPEAIRMSDQDHIEMLEAAVKSKAKIMISGYDSDLYNDYLSSWTKFQFNSCAEQGKSRIETVWCNYETYNQMSMFDIGKF